MSGEGKGIDPHFFHMNGKNARGLGGIDKETESVSLTEFPGLQKRQNRSAYIAGVGHDQRFRIGHKAVGKGGGIQGAVRAAPCPGKGYALSGQLPQGTHHRVMLHGCGNHMIPRL